MSTVSGADTSSRVEGGDDEIDLKIVYNGFLISVILWGNRHLATASG